MSNEIEIVVTSEARMDALRAAANDVNRLTEDELANLEKRKQARAAALSAAEAAQKKETEGDAAVLQARQRFLLQTTLMESKASGDRVSIITAEANIREASIRRTAATAQASEAEITRAVQANAAVRDRAIREEGAGTDILGSALGRLGTVYGAVYAAQTLMRWGQDALDMAVLAGQAAKAEEVFGRLSVRWGEGASRSLERLRVATQGESSDLQLMQQMGMAVDAGLSFENSIRAMEFLKLRSEAFGQNFESLMQGVLLALESGTTRGLRQAGIIIDMKSKMFEGLDEEQKKAMLLNLSLAQMEEHQKDLRVSADGAADASDKLGASWANTKVELGKLIDTPVAGFLNMISEGMANARKSWGEIATTGEVEQSLFSSVTHGAGSPSEKTLMSQTPAQKIADLIASKRLSPEDQKAIDDLVAKSDGEQHEQQLAMLDVRQKKMVEKYQGTAETILQIETAFAARREQMIEEHEKKIAAKRAVYTEKELNERTGIEDSILSFQAKAEKTQEERQIASERATEQALLDRVRKHQRASQATVGIDQWAAEESAKVTFAANQKIQDIQQDAIDKKLKAEEAANIKRHDEYQALMTQIQQIEARGTKSRLDDLDAEQLRVLNHMLKEFETRKLGIDQQITLLGDLAVAQKKQRDAEVVKENIHRILLYFDANTENVRDASDLAAYSMGLLTNRLRDLDPALRASIDSIQQIVVGMSSRVGSGQGVFQADGSLVEGSKLSAGAWAGIAAGGVALLNQAVNLLGERSIKAHQEFLSLAGALSAASEAGGAYSQSIARGSLPQLEEMFRTKADELRNIWPDSSFLNLEQLTINMDAFNAALAGYKPDGHKLVGSELAAILGPAKELQRLMEQIGQFTGNAATFSGAIEVFNHLTKMGDVSDPAAKLKLLNKQLDKIGGFKAEDLGLSDRFKLEELIHDLNRQIADVEIKARQEQAETVIESIHKQAEDVEKALSDAMDAQKQAALRAVGLTFDVQEMALRRSFFGRISGASTDPAEMARLVGEIGREIDTLRLGEQAAGTAELAKLRAAFDAASTANQKATQDQLAAIDRAVKDTSTAFDTSLAREVGGLATSLSVDLALGKAATEASAIDIVAGFRASAILDALDQVRVASVNTASIGASLDPMLGRLDLINTTLTSINTNTLTPGFAGMNTNTNLANAYLAAINYWDYITGTNLQAMRTNDLVPGLAGINLAVRRVGDFSEILNALTLADITARTGSFDTVFAVSNALEGRGTGQLNLNLPSTGSPGAASAGGSDRPIVVNVYLDGRVIYRDSTEPQIVNSLKDGVLSQIVVTR